MPSIKGSDIHKVIIACDAGMGSSVLVAGTLRKKLAPLGVSVEHTPVNSVPADADLVLCHVGLLERARAGAPDPVILGFQVFLGDPVFERVAKAIKEDGLLES
jgi:galactose PTS system EIIB component